MFAAGLNKRLRLLALFILALLLACNVTQLVEQPGPSIPIERGAELYNTYCVSCHGGAAGGQMMDIPPPHNANGHTWHHSDCQLTDIILNGSGAMGDMMRQMMGVSEDVPRMPAWKGKLTETEVAAILAYIKGWWTEDQRQMQAEITQAECS